jgi:hypothetical protein
MVYFGTWREIKYMKVSGKMIRKMDMVQYGFKMVINTQGSGRKGICVDKGHIHTMMVRKGRLLWTLLLMRITELSLKTCSESNSLKLA